MLCHERIDARLSDAEMLVMSGADVGDPHGFLLTVERAEREVSRRLFAGHPDPFGA